MFILTHETTEDHLTLSDSGLYTFLSNMMVTFYKLYYCVYSIQKRDMMKQKTELAGSHHPWRSISELFLKLSWLKKIFENKFQNKLE